MSDARDRLTTRELTFVREFAYRVACFRDRRPTSLKDTLLRHIYFYYSFIRPPVCSNGRTYKMLVMFFFLSPGSLRRPSTNRRETLPHDRKLVRLDKFCPKIRGGGALSPQKWGAKACKISGNFLPLLSLNANISGTGKDIENRKDM